MPASGEVEGYGPQTATVTDVRDPEGLGARPGHDTRFQGLRSLGAHGDADGGQPAGHLVHS